MSDIKDGGLFFPGKRYETMDIGHDITSTQAVEYPGATLRDFFAVHALMGMMASRNPNAPSFNPEDDAEYVYQVADAMLKAREPSS